MVFKYLRFAILIVSLFTLFNFTSICSAQQSNQIQKIKLIVISDQPFPLKDIQVTYWPIESPSKKKYATPSERNQFYLEIYSEDFGYEGWRYEITEPNHQKSQGDFSYNTPLIKVRLKHNNYYQRYDIDSTQLIEKFAEHSIELENTESKPSMILDRVFVNINLPVPKEIIRWKIIDKMDTTYGKHTSISVFSIRKKLYKELVREIILQPKIIENELFQLKIKEWIDSNYSNFKKKSLTEFISFGSDLSISFGTKFFERFEDFFNLISSAKISYPLIEAHKQGLLQSLITVIAYQGFQWENLDLIQKYFMKSGLESDKAFIESLNELRDDLTVEQNNDLTELIDRMKIKYIQSELSKEIVGFMLPEGLASGLEKFSIMNMKGIDKKITGLKISNIKYPTEHKFLKLQEWELMINILMILSQLDRYILNEFDDNYRDSAVDLEPDYYYGTLMRIYCGYIFNSFRKWILNVRNFNVEPHIKNQLYKIDQYESGIIKVSEEKENKAKSDYYLLSKLFPKMNSIVYTKRITDYVEDKKGNKSFIAIIIILIILLSSFIFIARIKTKKTGLHTINLIDLHSHKNYTFKKNLITIGRSKSNLIVISDPYIGKEHALIKFDEFENSYTIIDKGSKNGTFVNDVRVNQAKLKNGDEIKIGNSRFLVRF